MTSRSISRASSARTAQRWALAALFGVTLAVVAYPLATRAADAPVVRQVEAAPASTQQSQPVAARSEPAPIAVGDITRALLAAQADGRRAGSELGILGPVASASWKRYVDSFTYPQPELFEQRLEKNSSN